MNQHQQHHHSHDKVAEAGQPAMPVRFEFVDPTAQTVYVAGSFNHWQPEGNPLEAAGKGHWRSEINLSPGTYEYRFVVDGHWMPDPRVQENVANPYGGRNSILKVTGSTAMLNPADAKATTPEKTNNQKNKRL